MATRNDSPAAHLKRALGVWDLTCLCVVAIANLNIVPVIAAGGPLTVWLWIVALLFFFLPQGIAVIELAYQTPAEGGLYIWTKDAFGDFHGFLCGWCYWTTNMFFIPTLLFYLAGIATYAGGPALGTLAENRIFFFSLTVGLLWLAAWANIRGLGVGKWISNAGGVGTVLAASVLILLGIFTVATSGSATPAKSFRVTGFDLGIFATFGIICFGLVGLELGPVMGDEIREPRRTVPRGTLLGGAISGFLYIAATLALILAVPQDKMKVLQGVLQGVDAMATPRGWDWIIPPLAVLIAASIIGSTSAWLSGSARILFVSGIDRYLPKIFGRIHRVHGTPHAALITIAVISSLLVSMSFIGSTVKEAYVTLLDLSVVLQMISYLYLFGSLARTAFSTGQRQRFYRPAVVRFAAISGLVATAVGMAVAFVPTHQIDSIWRFELKMVSTCLVFLGVGMGLFRFYSKRRSSEAQFVEAVK